MKKFIALLLSSFMIFSTALSISGCKKDKDNPENENKEVVYDDIYNLNFKGTHQLDYTVTDKDFIKNGNTDYVFVFPKSQFNAQTKSKHMEPVLTELNYFYSMATGSYPVIVSDAEYQGSDKKYISFGNTTLAEEENIDYDKSALRTRGYVIKTVGNATYILANDDRGVLCGLYCFLNIYFNYEIFSGEVYTIDKNVTDKKYISFDVVDIPDANHVHISGHTLDIGTGLNDYDKSMTRLRFRSDRKQSYDGVFAPPYGDFDTYATALDNGNVVIDDLALLKEKIAYSSNNAFGVMHNSMAIVPPSVYAEEHPDWFAGTHENLCFTAHGNTEEYEALVKLAANKMKLELMVYGGNNFEYVCALNQMDDKPWCVCESCLKVRSQYGTDSAVVIRFINDVAKNMEDWFTNGEGKDYFKGEFHISTMAYSNTEVPPAKYDETSQSWVPMDESVRLHKYVSIQYAPCKNSAYTYMCGDELNELANNNLLGWWALCDNQPNRIIYYHYNHHLYNYALVYDTFTWYQSGGYQTLLNVQPAAVFIEAANSKAGHLLAWGDLKTYIDCQMLWDSSQDVGVLTQKYFNAMYKEAAPLMYEIFLEQRAMSNRIFIENEFTHGISMGLHFPEYWNYNALLQQLKKMEEALDIIEIYNNSKTQQTYQIIKKQILKEWFGSAHFILWNFSDKLPQAELKILRDKFVDVYELLGINMITAESTYTSIAEFIKTFS